MIATAETRTITVPQHLEGEGWLILRVGLPRLLRSLDTVKEWVDHFSADRFVEEANRLRRIPGSEALALLAAIPPEARPSSLDILDLSEAIRSPLDAILEMLGESGDEGSIAASLIRMHPSVVEPAAEVPGNDLRAARVFAERARQAIWNPRRFDATEADTWARSALAICETIHSVESRQLEADLWNTLGLANAHMGRVEQAIQMHERQLDITREIRDRGGEGDALGNLGIVYFRLGQVQKAIGFYEQALVIAREIGDRRGEGNALGNLGIAYKNLGQVEKAIGFYEQALVLSREIGDRRGEGVALGNLGIAYFLLGQVEKAIGFHEQQLEIVREIGDRRGEGNVLGNLGLAYKNLGAVDKAKALLLQALAIGQEIKDPRIVHASSEMLRKLDESDESSHRR